MDTMPIVPYGDLAKAAVDSGDDEVLQALAGKHVADMHSYHKDNQNDTNALRNAEMAARINPTINNLNNVGYLRMLLGDAKGALGFLQRANEKALKNESKSISTVLPAYNLAIMDALEGRLKDASNRFREVSEAIEETHPEPGGCSCLLVLKRGTGESLEIYEINEPDPLVAVSLCLEAIER